MIVMVNYVSTVPDPEMGHLVINLFTIVDTINQLS